MLSFLRLPENPVAINGIGVDSATTPRTLVFRTMFAVNRLTIPAAILMIVQQVGQAAVPIVMGAAIDRALGERSIGALVLWICVLAALYVVLGATFRLAFRLEILAAQLICYQLRQRVSARVLDPFGGSRVLPGVGLSTFTTDVNGIGTAPALFVYPLGQTAAILFVAIALFMTSWLLGIVVLVGAPVMIGLLQLVGGPMRRRIVEQQRSIGDATGAVSDLIDGLRVIKGLGAERAASTRYRRSSQRALDATLRVKTSQAAFSATATLLVGVFIAAVATLIGILAARGDLSIGELVAVVGLSQFVIGPVQSLSTEFGANWARAVGCAQRVLGILQSPPATADGDERINPVATLMLRTVALTVGPLRRLDLIVRAGECIGVVADGPAAQALSDALGRRRQCDDGQISLDGTDLSAFARSDLDRVLLVPPHGADLFDGSILDNVCRGVSATPEDVEIARAAMTATACDEMLAGFPDGELTRVGEGGVRLSGGQRQRVALARAMAARAPILVLHEPTTAVDSVTESDIAARLRAFRSGCSTVLITASPALLSVCDRVQWIREDGNSTSGTHQALMRDRDYAARFA